VHTGIRFGAALLATVALGLTACTGSSKDATQPTNHPSTSSTTTDAPNPSALTPLQVWPAPDDAMAMARQAGLTPETAERLTFHVHSHLDVFIDARPVLVPPGIGINIHDPGVHAFPNGDGTTSYGGIVQPCNQACISPLHTHDPDGILHTESATLTPNRLGQFFTEWAVPVTDSCVGVYCEPKTSIAWYVNGKKYEDDPNQIQLLNATEIALVIGTPPDDIPSAMPPQ